MFVQEYLTRPSDCSDTMWTVFTTGFTVELGWDSLIINSSNKIGSTWYDQINMFNSICLTRYD